MIEFIVSKKALILFICVVAVPVGIFSWSRLPIDAFPDASNQQVMILTEADGLGPLDVERQLTFPIESVMGGLPHVTQVRSMSKTGLSQVVVVFEDTVDTYLARQLVMERLQSAKDQLPPEVEPEMGPISTGLGEVLQYTLQSDRHSLTELRTMQDWLIAPRLRAVPGVNEVNSFGGTVRQIEVQVNPERLLKYNLTLTEVEEALQKNNANAGGGFIVTHWEQENIRNMGLLGSADEIDRIVLRAEDGTPVFIGDIADVVESHMTRLGAVTQDGEGETVAGMVIMLKGENASDVVERVKAVLPSIESSLPKGVKIEIFYDRTELVSAVVQTVGDALLQGGILVLLVLLLLIGSLRSALTAAISLPVTALFTFMLMDVLRLSANLMTLGGMAIAIGMVVDGAIVVTENINRHLGEHRDIPKQKVIVAALREVSRPIVFSILVIVLVFIPLFSLEGMEGKMFKPLALTMILSMVGSLVSALIVVPALLASLPLRKTPQKPARWFVAVRNAYLWLLKRTLTHPRLLAIAILLFFAAALAVVPFLGMEFLPKLDEGAIAINVVRLPNASIDGSVKTATFLEKELRKFEEVKTVVSKTGRAEISEDPMGPEQTDVLIMLHPESEWSGEHSKETLIDDIEKRLTQVPGIRLAFSQPIALRMNELISGVKSDLAVKLFGQDIDILKKQADEIASILKGISGAGDVNVEQIAGFSQLEIIPDRKRMARYQISMADINHLVETAVGGKIATELVDDQMRFGVKVRFPKQQRDSIDAVRSLLVRSNSGNRVPLERIADVVRKEGPAQISRESHTRRVVVELNVRGRDLGGFVREAQAKLKPLESSLPPGYWLDFGGTFESQQRAMKRLSIVVPVSTLFILMMLISALHGVKPALIVLINLPFALVGGVISMFLLEIPLNVPATVGFIALFGVAVQNGTVLVSFIRQLTTQGMRVQEAILEACTLRFRALLMTALTTILGLLPMLYAVGPGAEVQRPLAAVVIGGLFTATLLTLFVLPSLYLSFYRKP
ncbi:MAG: efflux RND transporter permease subunit [Deltaproteobacteria bacterium]|nr:efflux RND transporter permease subunit [Deltaproteobacteria bacterium]MBN2672763.1 efflux RND transporter permease subunit [Deltaproteobacteria bacterium]